MDKVGEAIMQDSKYGESWKELLRPDDWKKFVSYGFLGFFSFGAYKMAVDISKRKVDRTHDLKDQQDWFEYYPTLLKHVRNLQKFRYLSPTTFQLMIRSMDKLLGIHQILNEPNEEYRPLPSPKDKEKAASEFQISINRLKHFKETAMKKECRIPNKFVIKEEVKNIFTILTQIYQSIVSLCDFVTPTQMSKYNNRQLQTE